MSHIETGSGFAVELFVIIFSFYCWLFYTPASAGSAISTVQKPVSFVEPVKKPQEAEIRTEEEKDVQEIPNAGHIQPDAIETVRHLTLEKARKVASHLQDVGVIDSSIQLTGRGKGTQWVISLIKKQLPDHETAVKRALEEVLREDKTNFS
ncbi:hypothetical protein [Nostoc sp. ChiQUE01b]|uniref:hypothetical protein n=1 Tax=Nostoc sp. ChiQUE01b TaxID=3075376 RepID=UPI002AD2B7B4|nr:hypothetical protein [Nostoc sp. ChiQUE01b]MDZ8260586.1 hypothetical protein [Nostoc sp. ChiQUE01b]